MLAAMRYAAALAVLSASLLRAQAAPDALPGPAQLGAAAEVAGLRFTAAELEQMVQSVRANLRSFAKLRERVPELGNATPPALAFAPLGAPRGAAGPGEVPLPAATRPQDLGELAFASIPELAALVRSRQVRCVELTDLFLARLERVDPELHCVVSLLPDRARARARELDAMLDRGVWLGPLHGIPFGAKDLLAARGAPTTWGAAPFRDQRIERDAAVIENLEARGAVLCAKLSLGALAWGDVWFRGRTRNPWRPEQGSSGSSAGSAAATAAGALPFAIGSETLGSIVSPAARCGAVGLRPTFGLVPTEGAMVLSWSMDKLGPLCRSAVDAAIVLEAMIDDRERFRAEASTAIRGQRIGYLEPAFALARADRGVLDELEQLGCELVPLRLPDYPVGDMTFVLSVEAAAAFDELTRSGRDDLMVRQVEQAWPNVFRAARLVPAVEYLQAMRLRTLLMRDFEAALDAAGIAVYVHPTHGNPSLATTNLTGHPSIVLPRGFRADGTPASISFTGRCHGEAELLRVAQAWQQAHGLSARRPPVR
jgi:Asp-tRNA(Asn)/Glu-tRNA(Gln) amidotransferase A subunit family amidase